METHFNKFATWVPDGWLDQSTITFCMPASPDVQAPLSAGKALAHSPANLVLTWETQEDRQLSDYGSARLNKIKTALPGFHLVEEGLWKEEEASIFFAEYHISMSPALTQLLQIKVVDHYFVCLTGTAIQNNYLNVREHFKRSMRLLKLREDT
jgi:hypothetical protein